MLIRFLLSIFISLTVFSVTLFAQQPSQTIRGSVIDNASNSPVEMANVVVIHANSMLGATTDAAGNFKIEHVPVGRYDVKVTLIGYEPTIIREVLVSSARETFLTIPLKESNIGLNEVVIKANVNKEQPLNGMATLSARMLNVDEASRYAGGFDDPARLASSFAGVSSNIGNNGIVVRGNSPQSLQWKMEGIEIPNPNHFADLAAFGGGGLTALSTKMLANSDFFTGAFPAEYSNALSGVFDIYMRNGNNQKPEHSLQFGLIGLEGSSEGPFKSGSSASYLFNYRYSTLGLISAILPENGGGVTYQDLSFKLNFPTKKTGVFSVWGIGLIDGSGQVAKTDSTLWTYDYDKETIDVKQLMGTVGINHKYFFNPNVYLKTTLAATLSEIDLSTEKMDNSLTLVPENRINNKNWNFVLSTYINTKFNSGHTNKTGIVMTGLLYNMLLKDRSASGESLQTMVDEKGFSSLLSGYSNSTINITGNLKMNAGVNAQIFTLNKNYTIEPRIGLRWQFKPAQSIGFAYGLHSRLERLNYYFTKDLYNNNVYYNKNLDFSKAHHLVLSYDMSIKDNLHLKLETYFQKLFDIPVISDSSFSFINLQDDWYFNHRLSNTGEGRNYGLDATLEQYLTNGFYFMCTSSLFVSRYKGGDGIWRDTRYNRNLISNLLIGKEWQTGKSNQNTFGVSVRLSYQGGDHYSPVDEVKSHLTQTVVLDETKAFSRQLPASLTGHFTISYKVNRNKIGHEIALKVLNATMQNDFNGFQYNYKSNTIDEKREAIFIPNLSYRIEF